jgi:glucose-1-phosphate thymidylyltransferase
MKAVVLARGKGTRMQKADASAELTDAQRRYARSGIKAMVPLRGRPFLDYVLSGLADAAATHICIVIGPEHDVIRDHYTRIAPPTRLRLSFAVQAEALGTADAVLSAQEFVGDDPFLALNSDNYYATDVFRALVALDGPGLPAFSREALLRESNFDADRVRSFALLKVAPDGDLEDVIEKPGDETYRRVGLEGNAPISMNVWRFGPAIFTACRSIKPSIRGELELPEAVRYAVQTMHERFRTVPVDSGVLDLGRQADISEVERRLAGVHVRL